ncbi:hypothetical protein [Actinacidiphila sp. ITFR-21]|uniref:hypothetical protein n=1 Tax=Actinacidiphila sp. ITFR-21 TaxID=3075199 RepID=UPI00288AB3F5|nr:hypothetical protein [Streptomyces sp. ITFR-21]WNI20362.1 hypothetical protein RLT57_32685 [Streptomyces sp. ITFR-21]
MSTETPEQEPRIPGVKYRKVTRHRQVTTVLEGIPSTREVPYDAWEPVPPKEWDELILRGITTVAVAFTVIAVVATTASVGGLLSRMLVSPVAYGMGVVFTLSWVCCLGIEWLNRISPERARPARTAGWATLLLSMGAVALYGHTMGQPEAGVVGACIDMVTKGSWWLLIRHHAVPLDEGIAHWVTEREQELASRELLSARLLRLNRRSAYQRAVGGPEVQAAASILSNAQANRRLHATPPEATTLAPAAPAAPAHPTAPPVVPPATAPAETPAAPADAEHQAPVPPVAEITRPSIAVIVRNGIKADATVSDADLHAAVLAAGHPDRSSLADTVRRSAQREDPSRKNRKTS